MPQVWEQMANNVSISAGMISMEDGDVIKGLLRGGGGVTVLLNWTNIVPHQPRVAWELWTNSNDECGSLCNQQLAFIKVRTISLPPLLESDLHGHFICLMSLLAPTTPCCTAVDGSHRQPV